MLPLSRSGKIEKKSQMPTTVSNARILLNLDPQDWNPQEMKQLSELLKKHVDPSKAWITEDASPYNSRLKKNTPAVVGDRNADLSGFFAELKKQYAQEKSEDKWSKILAELK